MNVLESLYQQAVNNGIAVLNFDLPANISAAAQVGDKYYIGIDRARIETSYEEAEHLAHELGHCQTDSFYADGEKQRIRSEKRAEEWAILRLVPRDRFRAACRRGCHEIWEFAEELNISYAFAEKVMNYYLPRERHSDSQTS